MGRQKWQSPHFWSTPVFGQEEGGWYIRRGTCRNIASTKTKMFSSPHSLTELIQSCMPVNSNLFFCVLSCCQCNYPYIFLVVSSIFTASEYFKLYLPSVPVRVHPYFQIFFFFLYFPLLLIFHSKGQLYLLHLCCLYIPQ